jgi:type II secretory pathway component GspD/PulD (secretin)
VAASPIEETQTLIVTCYAHRMARIERLLNMVDRPGRPREFRFRQLQYTMAATLAAKVEALVAELQTKPVRVSPMEVEKPPSPPILTSGAPSRPFSPPRPSTTESSDSTDRYTVYLDTDERTNRILMIGYAEQLAVVEEVIDALDVAQHDPRAMKVYNIVHLSASDAKKKLEELEVIGKPSQTAGAVPSVFTSRTSSSSKTGSTDTMERAAMEETQVTVLETTNSLLINATDEQHNRIGTIIRHIDVAPQDLRILRVYDIKHIDAENVKKKLAELELVGKKSPADSAAAREPTAVTKGDAGADVATMQEPQVTVREATNSLLINATEKQHARIATIIDYIDVVQQDLRTLKVYDIQYVDADEVKKKLTEFELIGKKRTGKSTTTPASGPLPSVKTGNTDTKEQTTMQEPQVAVLESTNSLLINATEFQHAQMASIIKHVDAEVRKEAIPYEIYFLENQDPEALAEVLGKLIQETIRDKEDKIEQVARKTQEEIIIVPDKGTFSLVVYASRKNQEWVSKLIKALDRRRPQVLLDATLVEIRKTEEFDYDLNLIQSFPNLVATSGLTGTIVSGSSPITSSDIIEKLASSGRDRFIDYQSNSGDFKGFYGDKHINVLLGAMQSKNYGRVLAKPKVLVNDNETGTIQTVDSTYVEKKTSIPVVTGAAGQQSTLIETAIDFEKYDAGITLDITPHISEGDLLRLEIKLTRSDFGTITGDKPPDQTSSDINTVVTVPDGSTIILGGMLKLNQRKGGTKVPVLGDLPLAGALFRSVARSDIQSKLYVFVRAEIIRPTETLTGTQKELERISERDRAAFERHEEEFQNYEDWPGIKPKTTDPIKVLETR